ncbi:MAG: ABC transporter substrate-binding protein [Syntrophales bacterium]|nr:ABC transporter substrate-binding protein [Syntrophales bacterium]
MNVRKIVRVMVAVSLIWGALTTGALAAEPIKMGAILPLADSTGKDGSRSMELAVKQINEKGGLLGRQVKLIMMDDEMKGDKAAAALDKLVTVDNVDIIVGGVGSGATMGAIPGMKKYGKVVVWIGGASGKIEEAMAGQDWFFHLHAWDYQQGALWETGYLEMEQKYGIKRKKTFMAYEEGAFGSGSFKAGKPIYEAAGNELQGEAFKSAALGGGDYRSVLRHAKEFGAESFIWTGYDKDALPIMEQAKEIGFAPGLFVGSPPGWPVDFKNTPLNQAVMFYSYWSEAQGVKNKNSKMYSDAFRKEFKDDPVTYFGPLAYTNIMIVAEAIKRAGTLDNAALIKALEATSYASPMGDTFVFKKSKIIDHQAFASPKIMQWQNGKAQVVWPWEVATAKLIYPFPAWDKRDKAAVPAKKAKGEKK